MIKQAQAIKQAQPHWLFSDHRFKKVVLGMS